MSALKKGTGDATHHGDNKQNERGPGATNHPFEKSKGPNTSQNMVDASKWKSRANPNPPNQGEAKNTAPKVHMTPKINEGTGGQADGAKRVINGEAKPAGRNSTSSTYTAPRSEGSKDPMERGYTKL